MPARLPAVLEPNEAAVLVALERSDNVRAARMLPAQNGSGMLSRPKPLPSYLLLLVGSGPGFTKGGSTKARGYVHVAPR